MMKGEVDMENKNKSLSPGWKWEHDNYDGALISPEGKIAAEYDYATREYKINGEWHFMYEGFSIESLAQSAIIIHANEKDTTKII